ncbi:MAG: hypothetical protein M1462_04495 [Candidatus Thermoplasmatota archaeon]|jgi:hypothetical protein|uniref:hypothetical protein n=1 Tax=Ferroplasma sp. TaxID=2591003 RepID=UPI0026313E99|nr:hypothetical protein [Ferroplasma sp.]MCL4311668.1 hypothetical protein [Candidatus Thermoplasmatota archaeon]
MHTKEELARLVNLWQQKFKEAPEGSEEKMEANEMIRKYTTELEKPAKSGTTPEIERAKLDKGGGNNERKKRNVERMSACSRYVSPGFRYCGERI